MIKSEVGSVLKIRAFASNSWYQYNRTHMLRSEEGSVNKFALYAKKLDKCVGGRGNSRKYNNYHLKCNIDYTGNLQISLFQAT